MKKYLIIISIILIIVLGIDATKRFSHADPDTTNTHKLVVTNTTIDNKSLEATYKIKAKGDYYYAEVGHIGYFNGGDGSATFGSLYESMDDYNNGISSRPATTDSDLRFGYLDGYLNGGNIYYDGFSTYWDSGGYYYCVEQGDSYVNYKYVRDDRIADAFDIANNTPVYKIDDYRYIYEGRSTITLSNGKEYKLYPTDDINEDIYVYVNILKEDLRKYKNDDQAEIYDYVYYDKTINYDFENQIGAPDEEGYYTFTLRNNDSKTIPIPEGYEFELKQILPDNSELISINGSEEPIQLSGTLNGNLEYTFLNNKTVDDEPEQPIVDPEDPQDPDPTPSKPVNPVKEDKPVAPKTENVVKRSNTPNTVDKIIIDVELLTISMLVIGIMIMLIKRNN